MSSGERRAVQVHDRGGHGNRQAAEEHHDQEEGQGDHHAHEERELGRQLIGQVVAQALMKINSLDNAALIAELHSGDTFQSVQGDVKFDSSGQNIAALAYLFQWQKGALVPVFPANAQGAAAPEYPKPTWP